MNWEILGALGEIVGGLGVIGSLVYLGRQIRDNTWSNQSAAISSITDQVMAITIVDDESGRMFHSGLQGMYDMDEATRLIFVQRVTAVFIVWFNAYLQHQRNLIPDDFWNTFEGDIASYFQHKGIRETWQMISSGFPDGFVRYVDRSSKLESNVDYLAGTY